MKLEFYIQQSTSIFPSNNVSYYFFYLNLKDVSKFSQIHTLTHAQRNTHNPKAVTKLLSCAEKAIKAIGFFMGKELCATQ